MNSFLCNKASPKKAGIVMEREEKTANFNSYRTAKDYAKTTFERKKKLKIKLHTHII